MAFIPSYKHDVFVSYAHVDNKPLPGAKQGWVTTLVEGLETSLSQKLGRSEIYKLWTDDELSRHDQITDQIMTALEESAVILIILSPGYIASEWCQREKDTFLSLIEDRVSSGSRSRVFIIERDVVDEGRPEEFKEIKGYRFWVEDRKGKAPSILGTPKPDPLDKRYYNLLNDLSFDLAKELKRLQEHKKGIHKVEQVSELSPTLFLAEVTDDLEPQRDDVKRYLDQHSLRILPKSLYPRESAGFKKAMESDLSNSVLFVQLLSELSGKRPPDLSTTYARLQHELAVQSGMPILQWRHCDLGISSVSDKDQQKLLGKETVMAVPIEEFKRSVVEKALYKPPVSRKPVRAFVFVNMETVDREVAKNVCKCLDQYGAEYVLPLTEGTPADMRKDLEANLQECDGVIIIYGAITVKWVREQLRYCHKILATRDKPLRALAVIEGPPEPKAPPGLKLHDMQIINCHEGFDEENLKAFMDSLKGE